MTHPAILADPSPLLDLDDDVLLAVDTEFHAERRYTPVLHLVQVRAPGHEPWLIDPEQAEVWRAVAPKLPKHPWLVHAGSQDLVLLQRAFGSVPTTVLDTQIAAGFALTRYPAGLQRLLEHFLDLRIPKDAALSDWSRRPLTASQLSYAAGDVAHLHDLWDAILAAVPHHRAAILGACDEARSQALEPGDGPFLALGARNTMSSEQAAVLRALTRWREEEARANDQPAPSVLGHGTLIAIAKGMPASVDALVAGRRSPKKVLRRFSDALLPLIAQTRASDPSTWPRPLVPGTVRAARFSWLCAWAEALAVEQGWSARLVTPTDLLERWVDEVALDGWRAEVLQPHISTIDQPLPPIQVPGDPS